MSFHPLQIEELASEPSATGGLAGHNADGNNPRVPHPSVVAFFVRLGRRLQMPELIYNFLRARPECRIAILALVYRNFLCRRGDRSTFARDKALLRSAGMLPPRQIVSLAYAPADRIVLFLSRIDDLMDLRGLLRIIRVLSAKSGPKKAYLKRAALKRPLCRVDASLVLALPERVISASDAWSISVDPEHIRRLVMDLKQYTTADDVTIGRGLSRINPEQLGRYVAELCHRHGRPPPEIQLPSNEAITVLNSLADLRRVGRRMKNCLGGTFYLRGFLAGRESFATFNFAGEEFVAHLRRLTDGANDRYRLEGIHRAENEIIDEQLRARLEAHVLHLAAGWVMLESPLPASPIMDILEEAWLLL